MKFTWWFGGLCLAALGSGACAGQKGEPEMAPGARARAEEAAEEAARARRGGGSSASSDETEVAEADEEPVVDPLQLAGKKSAPRKSTAVTDASDRGTRQEKNVAVQGIEGTLSEFDVRVTLEKRGKAFASCHEPRARKVPALAGAVEFKIHVLQTGAVSAVRVHASDLGDRVLERCLSDVIQAAKFPEPHGGEADVSYSMNLEPLKKGRKSRTEQWETDHIERVLRKNRSELLETCDAKRAGGLTVTAYVSRRGKVLSAGVADSATKQSSPEQLDCIAEELRSWSMPKPKKGVAKVSFPLKG